MNIDEFAAMALLVGHRHKTAESRIRAARWRQRMRRSLRRAVRCVADQAVGYHELRKLFEGVVGDAKVLTRRHVILMAHMSRVSHEVLVNRLAYLGLAKPGSWAWFQANHGIKPAHIRAVLYGEEER